MKLRTLQISKQSFKIKKEDIKIENSVENVEDPAKQQVKSRFWPCYWLVAYLDKKLCIAVLFKTLHDNDI